MGNYLSISVVAILFLFIYSCNEGLAPAPEPEVQQEGFGGKIFFTGEWQSNVTRTHIIIFKNPLNTPEDFSLTNLVYVSQAIPPGVTEFNYSTLDSAFYPPNIKPSAGTYSYIAVAQQTTAALTLNRADWFIAGFYHTPGNDSIPGTVTIPQAKYITNVNIYCDFNSPPPQPPG